MRTTMAIFGFVCSLNINEFCILISLEVLIIGVVQSLFPLTSSKNIHVTAGYTYVKQRR